VNWAYPALTTAVAGLAGWWLSRRRYRRPDDTVYRTAPAWLMPVLAAVGALLASPFYLGQPLVVIVTYALALVWGLLLAFIDADVHRLPDVLTLPAYPVAGALLAACSAVTGDWTAMARAAACAGIAVAVFLLAALVASGSGGLGLGDVKLVGVLGGLLGWHSWFSAVLGLATGCVIGGLMAVVLLVFRRAERTSLVAYGPSLIAGSYVWAALAPIL
jgi:leader peptidase (prepilin peptidase)/N-methyltransferase